MAVDPRTFTIACPDKNNTTSDKFNVFDAISKVSDLEINNKVVSGLRNIVKIGKTAQAKTIVGDGTLWVFDKMGMSYELTNSVIKDFNSGVANRSIGAAKQIAEKVKEGNFELEDVPQYVADFQNLETLIRGVYTPDKVSKPEVEVCHATNYAKDLIEFAPKFKFHFVVEFVMRPGYENFLGDIKPAAFCKQFQLPTPTFQYEDVNMYNFRTKVLTHVTYPPAQMTFYDDGHNHVMEFFTKYLKDLSPIANLEDPAVFEDNGMNFGENSYSGSMRPPTNGVRTARRNEFGGLSGRGGFTEVANKTVISQIRVYQIYHSGYNFNMYSFINPRINEFQLDQLDMEDTQTTAVNIDFNYDSLLITNNLSFEEKESTISNASALGQSRLRFVSGRDVGASTGSASPLDIEKYEEDAKQSLLDRGEELLGGISGL